MILVALTIVLILVGVGAYFYGAVKLAKYGFRLGTGVGLAVIFFPPYTFYFAFKKLEVDGKELPTALCCFGLVLSIGLVIIFWHPLSLTFTGQFEEVEEFMTVETAPEEMTVQAAADALEAGDEDALDDVDDEIIEEAEDELEEREEDTDPEEEDTDPEEEDAEETEEDDEETEEDDEETEEDDDGEE